MKNLSKLVFIFVVCATLAACGSNGKKNVAMNIHSDPLGAYLLMQVKYKGDENPEWVFLGPTPVVQEKAINYRGATSVSLKVIRPGFFEQTKSWKAKDFFKEHRQHKKIRWVPSLVKQQ